MGGSSTGRAGGLTGGLAPRAGGSTLPAMERRRPFRVIAHRGGAAHAPESTLPAFERCADLGVEEVETDLRLSRDGALVLFHDADLAATTDGEGPVEARTAAELARLDAGSRFDAAHPEAETRFAGTPLLFLPELLARFGRRFHYHLEIKGGDPELPSKLAAAVRKAGLGDRVTLTSFSWEQLARARAADPELLRCVLLLPRPGDAEAALARAAQAGMAQVAIAAPLLTPELVAQARGLGLAVRAWRVRDEDDMEQVLDAGADGATVDDPDRLLALLRRRDAVSGGG